MKTPRYHSITNIVAIVYCERQAILDQQYGRARPVSVRIKAAHGVFEHKRFEMEGKALAAVDKRCFIASAVYGSEAPQTWRLRQWRDDVLKTSCLGRIVIRLYYAFSPGLVTVLETRPRLAIWVRRQLDRLLRVIGGEQ